MAFLYPNEAFNLYVGTDDPDASKKKIITNLQIPDMEEMTQQHHAGGSKVEIEVGGLGIKALSAKFKSNGWDPQTMSQFAIEARPNSTVPYIAKSVVRDKRTGAAMGVKAVMWGRLTKLSASEMRRGDMFGHDHEIKEILHYELYFNNQEKFFFDFFDDTFRIDGQNQNQDEIDYL